MNYNKTILIGNLTKKPEKRVTDKGTSIATFTLAVNNGYGENKKASFINCVAFKKTAELAIQYLEKGSNCLIEGRLNQQTWQDNSGNNKSRLEVIVNRIEFGARNKEEKVEDEIDEEDFDVDDLFD